MEPSTAIVKFCDFSVKDIARDEPVEINPNTVVIIDHTGVGVIKSVEVQSFPSSLAEGAEGNRVLGPPAIAVELWVVGEAVPVEMNIDMEVNVLNPQVEAAVQPRGSQVAEAVSGRRSKRLRIFSTKLDGRFQYNKKTKLLVGHPSPVVKDPNFVDDPEKRLKNSIKKLKASRSISLGGEASLSIKEVFDIIEMKNISHPRSWML